MAWFRDRLYVGTAAPAPQGAEDLAQEVFLRVFRARKRYVATAKFSTWLFTIAKRLYVNANQKLQPRYDSEVVGAWRSTAAPPRVTRSANDARMRPSRTTSQCSSSVCSSAVSSSR